MRKPTVTVLGGTGFVGRHLVPRLREHAACVRVLTRNRNQRRELAVVPGVQLQDCNVHDPQALQQALAGSDAVVNLVGILNEPGRGGAGFQRAHTELTRTLVGAMRSLGIARLLQMSALQAGAGESHYLRTRGEAEQLVRDSGLSWTLYRPSVIFGAGDGLYFRFADLLRRLPPGLPLPLAHAHTRFQPVYVGNVVDAMLRTFDASSGGGKTLELVGPQTFTLAEIVCQTGALIERNTRVLPLPGWVGRLQGWVFDWMPLALKLYSSDNDRSLRLDSTSTREDLRDLGVEPTRVDTVMPGLLGAAGRQAQLDRVRRRVVEQRGIRP